jgi:hypothetical protein
MTNWNELLTYDPITGILTWKNRPREHFTNQQSFSAWHTKYAGRVAGSRAILGGCEYIVIRHRGKKHLAHRIIWTMTEGPIPDDREIDHENRIGTDNKKKNLRLATRSQNLANKATRNKTGYKGVREQASSGRFYAGITIEGAFRYLGTFDTPMEASEAYQTAFKAHYGSFTVIL